MARVAVKDVTFDRLLDTVERLSPREQLVLKNKIVALQQGYYRHLAAQARQDLDPQRNCPTTPSGFPIVQITLEDLENELRDYETRFGFESEAFYERYQRGEMGDALEFVQWAGAYSSYLDLLTERDAQI